jgi:isopentenyl-diphosphate Delta-isomerase
MTDPADILRRKEEHLDLALAQQVEARPNAFDRVRLSHRALPEIDMDAVDLSTTFLGRRLALPFLIGSMTGGPARGGRINENLAAAAQSLRIALAVGSQRVALEAAGDNGLSRRLRDVAPDALLLANFGGAQLAKGYGVDEARRAVEMIGADGLIIHLNPLQEAVQADGDRDWRGVLAGIERLAKALDTPLLVKEVGFGISGADVRRLAEAGVVAVEVAGRGGTNWTQIEADRARSAQDMAAAAPFLDWGFDTPDCIRQARAAAPDLALIGSGGVRHGLDAARAVALGADLVAQAGAVLKAAMTSAEVVEAHFRLMARQLRIACFVTGSADLAALRRAPLID